MFDFNDSRFTHMPFASPAADGNPKEFCCIPVNGVWKLWHLNVSSVMRYNEIQKAIPQATAKMLSQQLKELESDGIIRRKLYPVVPPKTEYSLTELGKPLVPIVNAMSDWGHNYFEYLGVPDPCPED